MTSKSNHKRPFAAAHSLDEATSEIDSATTRGGKRRVQHWKLLARGFNKRMFALRNPDGYYRHGVNLFAADWDTCIILDACRFDMLAAVDHSLGEVDARRSRGSGTKQFLKANLDGKTLLDTVYVTANPQLYKHRDEIDVTFHAVDEVWRDGWDPVEKTVTPAVLTERALAAATKYPDKRLLVHYMQPHYPFIGSPHDFDKQGHIFESKYSFWMERFLGLGNVPRSVIWKYYTENLEIVLPAVEQLVAKLPGKTVVTADHGNMVGERSWPLPIREWGHPTGIYTPELVTVPWVVCENGPRKHIVATEHERTAQQRAIHEDLLRQRLAELGYV